jgi:hypothetical protein
MSINNTIKTPNKSSIGANSSESVIVNIHYVQLEFAFFVLLAFFPGQEIVIKWYIL